MRLDLMGRLGSIAAIVLGLAGCVDVKVDVAVLENNVAKGTMTQSMDADVYEMFKAGTKGKQGHQFCQGAKAELTENTDGSATCRIVVDGTWMGLTFDEEQRRETVSILPQGDGLVRVAFPVTEVVNALSNRKGMDEQTKSMLVAMFQGHTLTLTVTGGEIVDTNMALASDKQSAQEEIAFLDLLDGAGKLPEEYYAVVKVK